MGGHRLRDGERDRAGRLHDRLPVLEILIITLDIVIIYQLTVRWEVEDQPA